MGHRRTVLLLIGMYASLAALCNPVPDFPVALVDDPTVAFVLGYAIQSSLNPCYKFTIPTGNAWTVDGNVTEALSATDAAILRISSGNEQIIAQIDATYIYVAALRSNSAAGSYLIRIGSDSITMDTSGGMTCTGNVALVSNTFEARFLRSACLPTTDPVRSAAFFQMTGPGSFNAACNGPITWQ